ncbi:MAG: hypothetical protein WDN25_20425 [Acetobacteraceae bacterium]
MRLIDRYRPTLNLVVTEVSRGDFDAARPQHFLMYWEHLFSRWTKWQALVWTPGYRNSPARERAKIGSPNNFVELHQAKKPSRLAFRRYI